MPETRGPRMLETLIEVLFRHLLFVFVFKYCRNLQNPLNTSIRPLEATQPFPIVWIGSGIGPTRSIGSSANVTS